MVDPSIPSDVATLAQERAVARGARDWARADELKAIIESAGWRIIDDGPFFTLEPALSPDIVDDARTYFGSPLSVPSRLHEPAASGASVVLIARHGISPDVVLQALRLHQPEGTQVLVVADRSTEVGGPADEVIGTAERFSAGDALSAALRRTIRETVVVLDAERIPSGDIVTPLVDALRDRSVAIVGEAGLVSTDLHRYQAVDDGEVTTVDSSCYAFRRDDAAARGPIDGRLQLPQGLAIWLGLLLRDEGEARPTRRALVVDLPLQRIGITDPGGEQARLVRRDRYRIAARFRECPWLAGERRPQGRVGDGTDDRQQHDDADEAGDPDEA